MKAEVITIGDELLLGFTVDTNSAFIARQLSGLGFEVAYKTTVGDSLDSMEEAFRLALRRVQVVVTTGGLGPTDDDLTKRAIVKVFKRNLIFHEDILEKIKERFAARGMEMPALSQNQALQPQGATFFTNALGSAVGICLSEQGKIFISLPGVPIEMRRIMTDEVIPYLSKLNLRRSLKVITLRTTGIGESHVFEKISDGLKFEPGVKLAYLPGYGAVDLRVIASADTPDDAEQKAQALVRHLEKRIGHYIFGHDNDTLEGVVGQLLKDNDRTLSVAESCTAGQLGMTVTAVPGSSGWFKGGVIAYDNEVKIRQLGVSEEILAAHGAVSQECVLAMAAGARSLFKTDFALAITGIAGPDGGTTDKPVGTTWIGLASARENYARLFVLGRDREINRTRAVNCALELLRREILDIK